MLRKQFHIGSSRTKSVISFRMPNSEPHTNVKQNVFRDPAAIPTLQKISDSLQAQGYAVTEPMPGKACHGFCIVAFANVEIEVMLSVQRRESKIEFEVMTWPSQSFRQRMAGRKMTHPDCKEWGEVASAIHTIVTRNLRAETVTLRTFAEAGAEA